MGTAADLVRGLAQLLHAAEVGAFREDSAYQPGEVGISFDMLPESPDDLICLSDYPVSDDPALSDSTVGVQVRTRRAGTNPLLVKDLDDEVFDVLQGWAGELATGVKVVSCSRRSGVSLGSDGNGRWRRSSNYYLLIHRPSPHRS